MIIMMCLLFIHYLSLLFAEKCSATEIDPDCIECAFDASGTPICAMCKGGVEPGEDGKCPTSMS